MYREGRHLAYSWGRLYAQLIDLVWVNELEDNPELAERLEAFVSRYGRMQDTIAGKLLPRWLLVLAETPGSQIETLMRAEQLGVIESVERWLEARTLRNRLVHEYMVNAEVFVEDLQLARDYSLMILESYNRLCSFATSRMGIKKTIIPEQLELP